MKTVSNIQQLKYSLDIVDTIRNSGVTITKHGKDYFGLCPFHSEKTPSFSVSPAKQIFHCFGCGAGGDVIEYVQKYYKLDFPEALKFLNIADTQELPVKKIKRQVARKHRADRRKRQEQELLKSVQDWAFGYGVELVEWIEIIEYILKKLTWEEIKELSALKHFLTIWKYHIWLIYTAKDEAAIYELWKEKNKA